MLPTVKNFCISLLVGLLIFGTAGYLLKPLVIDDIIDGFLSPGGQTGEVTDSPESIVTDAQTDPAHTDTPVTPSNDIEGESFTMLLIGSDYQPTVFKDYRVNTNSTDLTVLSENQRHYGADTLVIVRFDVQRGECMISSIPVNLDVTVNGVTTKLYDVLESKGKPFLLKVVKSLIGLEIDYYIEARIDTFKTIINYLGGIKFNVPCDMYYVDESERIIAPGASSDPIPRVDTFGNPVLDINGVQIMDPPGNPFTVNLKTGIQTLNGDTASQLLRYKNYADGQSKRREVAASFIKAVFDSSANAANHDRLLGVLQLIAEKDSLSTNITALKYDEIVKMFESYPKFKPVTVSFPCTDAIINSIAVATYTPATAYAAYADYKLK